MLPKPLHHSPQSGAFGDCSSFAVCSFVGNCLQAMRWISAALIFPAAPANREQARSDTCEIEGDKTGLGSKEKVLGFMLRAKSGASSKRPA